MKFSKEEKEIVKVIVKYANNSKNIASAFNASGLLEKRGIAIVDAGGATLLRFLEWICTPISSLMQSRHICRYCST